MIDQAHFIKKIKEIKDIRLLSFTQESAKFVYHRFKNFDQADFDQAVEAVAMSDERFDFRALLKICTKQAIYRRESEAKADKLEWNHFERAWPKVYCGECSREVCRGCPHVDACTVRGGEWLKNINSILRRRGGKAEAEEVIRFMQYEFMGGIR